MSMDEKDKRRPSRILMYFYVLFLLASVTIAGRILYIQYIWKPDHKFAHHFRPEKKRAVIEPRRGSVIDRNGKLLAISTPMYNIYMDCYVQKEANSMNGAKGAAAEREWVRKAGLLSKGLAKTLQEQGRDSAYYMNRIMTGRVRKMQHRSMVMKTDHGTLLKLKELPLFNEPSYKGGLIVEEEEKRLYPYGSLARRVIGYVKNNRDTTSRHIGIEGRYDYVLHGKAGVEWQRRTDMRRLIQDIDSTFIAAEDGLDVRTTIDIDMQDIADRALRENMSKENNINGGCAVIMDVKTGAIRAMVNLQRDSSGRFSEVFNMAAGWPSEPGSVFKAVTLATLLEDGKVELDTELKTNHGAMSDMPDIPRDEYITNYERRTGRNTIPVVEGFKISSNYVFRRLVKDNYGSRPEEFTSRLHSYGLDANFDFELAERGSGKPRIPDPHEKGWTMSDLVSSAIGYSVRVTPLQIVTFYNAIANKGRMMKPYIVASTEKNGATVQEFGPVTLNSICSKATADTLTRALRMVTLEGTAKRLRNAKCTVAGKTGTARMHLLPGEKKGSKDPYSDNMGRKKHQATFVGFFPADNPKYTAIVVTYTGLMPPGVNVYGGQTPAMAFKDIVDGIWAYEPQWSSEIKANGKIPEMAGGYISTSLTEGSPVPDLSGMGLKDAIYAIENNGYRCSHTGTGHVVSQSPRPGTAEKKGETVRIVLK